MPFEHVFVEGVEIIDVVGDLREAILARHPARPDPSIRVVDVVA